MASTWVLVSKLGSMMLEAVIGFLIVRLGLVKAEDTGILSRIVVDVFTPCLIINAFQIDITPEKTRGFIAALILSTAYFAVAVLFTWALRKPMHLDAIDSTTIIYPNVGNLIMPLVSMTLGSDMVFYAGAMQIPFNIFVWTQGMSAIRGEKKINLKKAFLNSNMISVFIGLIFLLTGFRTPDVITTVMTGFGGMVGPLSMLVIGMQIATAKLPEVFACRKAYLVIFLRLIALPSLILLLLYATGFMANNPDLVPVIQVAFMAIAAPPAATVSQLAILYDNQPLKASICNMLGIIFCIVTIPLIIAFYGALFA